MRCLHGRTYDKAGKCPVCHMELLPVASAAPRPIGYKCPLHYSDKLFPQGGRCPFCTLELKPVYAQGQSPQEKAVLVEAWPRVQGKTAVYFRPSVVQPVNLEHVLRLAGKISRDKLYLLARLPDGEEAPSAGNSAMIAPAEGSFRPMLGSVASVKGGSVNISATRRLEGFEHANIEVRLPLKRALAVPVEALRQSDGHAWVFRLGPNGYEPVSVTVGVFEERFVEITGGLADGDTVAASGVFWLEAQWRLDHPEASL